MDCNFCDNSGKSKSTLGKGNFQILIYGNKFLRICANIQLENFQLRNNERLYPEAIEINFCPFCGRKLN